ncbi:hypothetical protein [Caballeronia cordobensis]|uniref:hypothetical protein n=1 Tax=Caballeronia cordobensis TaxID=1353886 RepID=UPI000AF76CDC
MAQTIIGVFDSFADAERAQSRLESEGIARADMEVHSSTIGDANTMSEDPTTRSVTNDTGEDRVHDGPVSGIEHFF